MSESEIEVVASESVEAEAVTAPEKEVEKPKPAKKKVAKKKVSKKKTSKKTTKKVTAKKAAAPKETAREHTGKTVVKAKRPTKAGKAWLANEGAQLMRKGHGQRNIIHKAAQAAGKSFDDANVACALPRVSLEEKVLSLFD